jgi:hypothetical protein
MQSGMAIKKDKELQMFKLLIASDKEEWREIFRIIHEVLFSNVV